MKPRAPLTSSVDPELLASAGLEPKLERCEGDHSPSQLTIEVWRGIVAGRWTVVAHFLRDGRQYLVARRRRADDPRYPLLTPREHEVAANAICGSSNKAIGYRLGISETTVATHLRKALEKLGIHSRIDLIRLLPREAFELAGQPYSGR